MILPPTSEIAVTVLFIGLLLIGYAISALMLKQWHLPVVLGGIATGLFCRISLDGLPVLATSNNIGILEFLGTAGVVCLLFRIGLEAKFSCLKRQFNATAFLWITNVSASGFTAFAAARWWLGYDLITSLILAVALSATSVGIPVEVWRRRGKLNSANGQRFLELAQLDGVSAVLLMALLISVMPALAALQGSSIWLLTGSTVAGGGLKLGVLFAVCWFFSKFVEEPFTDFLQITHPIVAIAGIGFVISAMAGILGFPIGVGAFFAGLAFSRDPRAVKIDAQFESLYEFFTPFFFIYLGFQVPAQALGQSITAGGVLLLVAVVGKLIGVVFPARFSLGWRDSLTLGVSTVPRAEIALLIVATSSNFGTHQLPDVVYPAVIVVALATSAWVPAALNQLLGERMAKSSVTVPAPVRELE